MDLERALVSKIVFTGEIDKVLSRNITVDHFVDDECRDLYQYIVDYTRRYKQAPPPEVVKHDKPQFDWLSTDATLKWIIDRFAVLVKRRMADDYILELAKAADDIERRENIDIEFLQASQQIISAVPTSGIERLSEMHRRIDEHQTRSKSGIVSGVPYGYPTLDRMTRGIHRHQLISVLGFTNVGKSTLLRTFAFNIWAKGFTPLYFSLEMEAEDIFETLDAMAANLDYGKLRQLQLSEVEIGRWRQVAERIQKQPCDIPIIDSLYRITPDNVYAETLRYKPDVVIIDYIGLMRSTSISRGVKRYQQITEITQDLKIIARTLRTPIIMAAQTNRSGSKDGAELDNVADAISISQDSDVVIGLFQDDAMEENKEMEIRINKNRKGPRGKFKAVWNHEEQDFRERTVKDMFERANGDKPEAKTGTNVDRWMQNRIQGFARVTA